MRATTHNPAVLTPLMYTWGKVGHCEGGRQGEHVVHVRSRRERAELSFK